MMTNSLVQLTAAALATVAVNSHTVNPSQPLIDIQNTAKAYVSKQVDRPNTRTIVSVGKLDPRLRLPRCDQPLHAFSPNDMNNQTASIVGIKCEGTQNWSVYVPVHVSLFKQVVAAKRAIPRGHLVTANDLKLVEKDIHQLTQSYYLSADEVIGNISQRAIAPGSTINPSSLKKAMLVKRGELVTISAVAGPIKVQMKGKALREGAKGDLIQVENQNSKRIIEAEITAPGQVKIRL